MYLVGVETLWDNPLEITLIGSRARVMESSETPNNLGDHPREVICSDKLPPYKPRRELRLKYPSYGSIFFIG